MEPLKFSDLKGIVKQYGYWEQKINDIEGKLKSENEELLSKTKALQTESCKLQEALASKNKDLVEKIEIIESLSAKLKENANKQQKTSLDPVNEAICQRCKESLEESRNFGEKGISGIIAEEKVKELTAEITKMQEAFKEKAESENRIKKELEDQVDLVLKMEEERLIMMKESKITKEQLAEAMKKPLPPQSEAAETTEVGVVTDPMVLPVLSEKTKEVIAKAPPVPTSGKTTKTTTKTGKKTGFGSSKKKLTFEKPNMTDQSASTDKDSLSATSSVLMPQTDTKDALAQEIIKSNRENTKLKKELRAKEDGLKKVEKELTDIKKQLSIKIDMVEKLRRENGEMAVTLQADQFKSVRLLENEKNQALAKFAEAQKKLTAATQSKADLEQELDSVKKALETVKKSVESLENTLAQYKDKAEKYDSLSKEAAEQKETLKKTESEKTTEKAMREQLAKEKAELEKKVIIIPHYFL